LLSVLRKEVSVEADKMLSVC